MVQQSTSAERRQRDPDQNDASNAARIRVIQWHGTPMEDVVGGIEETLIAPLPSLDKWCCCLWFTYGNHCVCAYSTNRPTQAWCRSFLHTLALITRSICGHCIRYCDESSLAAGHLFISYSIHHCMYLGYAPRWSRLSVHSTALETTSWHQWTRHSSQRRL